MQTAVPLKKRDLPNACLTGDHDLNTCLSVNGLRVKYCDSSVPSPITSKKTKKKPVYYSYQFLFDFRLKLLLFLYNNLIVVRRFPTFWCYRVRMDSLGWPSLRSPHYWLFYTFPLPALRNRANRIKPLKRFASARRIVLNSFTQSFVRNLIAYRCFPPPKRGSYPWRRV